MALQHFVEACPTEHVLTITPREPFPPYPGNLVSEPTQSSTVAADAVVGEVAPHQQRQMTVLVADGPVPAVPTPVVHCGHSAGDAALGRDLPNHVLSVPRPSPDMGEAEKVEHCPSLLRVPLALCLSWAEVDEARLVGVKRQPMPFKTLVQYRQDAFGIDNVIDAITASSANWTRVLAPLRRGLTSLSNHLSNTWCRKTFERQGEITPPCGEPSVAGAGDRFRRPLPSTICRSSFG